MPPFRFSYLSGEIVTVTPGTIVFHYRDGRWFMRAYDETSHKVTDFDLAFVSALGTATA